MQFDIIPEPNVVSSATTPIVIALKVIFILQLAKKHSILNV